MKALKLFGVAVLAAVILIVLNTGCATGAKLSEAGTKAKEAMVATAGAAPAIVDDGTSLVGKITDWIGNLKNIFKGTNAPAAK